MVSFRTAIHSSASEPILGSLAFSFSGKGAGLFSPLRIEHRNARGDTEPMDWQIEPQVSQSPAAEPNGAPPAAYPNADFRLKPHCQSLLPVPAGNRPQSPLLSTLMKASWGIFTLPNIFIFFLPSFCFSSSLRFRVMSPP